MPNPEQPRESSQFTPDEERPYTVEVFPSSEEKDKAILISGEISGANLLAITKKEFSNTPFEDLEITATYDQEIHISPKK